MDQISASLEHLRVQIEQWREVKQSPRERMPGKLWEQAVSLCSHRPPTRVAKELGLSYPNLKRRLIPQTSEPTGKFLQLPRGLGLGSELSIELRHGGGKELCISGDCSSVLPIMESLFRWLDSRSS